MKNEKIEKKGDEVISVVPLAIRGVTKALEAVAARATVEVLDKKLLKELNSRNSAED